MQVFCRMADVENLPSMTWKSSFDEYTATQKLEFAWVSAPSRERFWQLGMGKCSPCIHTWTLLHV